MVIPLQRAQHAGVYRTLLLFGFLAVAGCHRLAPIDKVVKSEAVSKEFRSLERLPIRPSPNEKWVVYTSSRADSPYGFELTPMDGTVASLAFHCAQPLLRPTWRPDSAILSYFRQQESTERELWYWNVAEDTHSKIDVPPTHNQYVASWSPAGTYYAYASDRKELVLVRNARDIIRFPGEFRSFAWSPDEKHIVALLADKSLGEVMYIDIGTAKETYLHIPYLWDLKSVEWSPEPRVIVRGTVVENRNSVFFALTFPDFKMETPAFSDEEVSQPRWIPHENMIAWTSQKGSGWRDFVVGRLDGTKLRKYDLQGNVEVREICEASSAAYLSVVSPAQYGIVKIDLRNLATPPVNVAGNLDGIVEKGSYDFVTLPSKDGQARVHIARPAQSSNSGVVVIRMLGGPMPQFAAQWAERQLYVRHGVTYIAVPNREQHGEDDLLAVCVYARSSLGASRENVAVLGESTAARLALQVALRQPAAFGHLIIVGLTRGPALSPVSDRSGLRVLAFHGEHDPFAPEKAYKILVECLGARSLSAPNGLWHVFPGEAHSLRAAVPLLHATVLAELGRIPAE